MDEWDITPLNVHFFCSKGSTLSCQWAFKWISAPAAAEKWHLKGRLLKVKEKTLDCNIRIRRNEGVLVQFLKNWEWLHKQCPENIPQHTQLFDTGHPRKCQVMPQPLSSTFLPVHHTQVELLHLCVV
jgi:hypothetical protein